MDDEPVIRRTEWNMPPGPVKTYCPDCGGSGTLAVQRQYVGSDAQGSMTVPSICKSCRGKGSFPGIAPPA